MGDLRVAMLAITIYALFGAALWFIIKTAVISALRQHDAERARAAAGGPTSAT